MREWVYHNRGMREVFALLESVQALAVENDTVASAARPAIMSNVSTLAHSIRQQN